MQKIDDTISLEKIERYINITKNVLDKTILNTDKDKKNISIACLEMVKSYYNDAKYFKDCGDYVNALGAINYSHGWLDCCLKSGLFLLKE